jgi:hypothetical protein
MKKRKKNDIKKEEKQQVDFIAVNQYVKIKTFVQKNVWSIDLVLIFVSVNVWRSFISCQMFRETESEERKSGAVDYHQYVF